MAMDVVVPDIIMQKHLLPCISFHSREMKDLIFDAVKPESSYPQNPYSFDHSFRNVSLQ